MDTLWSVGFFKSWAAGFPGDREIDEFIDVTERLTGGPHLEPGGSLFIFNPYSEKTRAAFFSTSLADTLRLWARERILKNFRGVHDLIALNLFDLKKEVDDRVAKK